MHRFALSILCAMVDGQSGGGGRVSPVLPRLTCENPPNCTQIKAEHAYWSSRSSLTRENIVIDSKDPHWAAGAPYTVAVYGTGNSRTIPSMFTLTGSITTASNGSVTTLQDGVPHQDTVAKDAYQYYRVIIPKKETDVMITVTPEYGDPDIYVSLSSDNPRPTRGHSDKTSSSFFNDTVYVQWSEIGQCNPGVDCAVFIGVNGFSEASYSIVATLVSDIFNPTLLRDGVAQRGSVVQKGYAYFRALIDVSDGDSYAVSVVPVSGDPDLYVSLNASMQPSTTQYDFRSQHFGVTDEVVVSPESPKYKTRGVMLIAVYGSTTSEFTITYSTSASVSVLQDGQPQDGYVARFHYRYYLFAVPKDSKDLTFAVTPHSGDPDLFVKKYDENDPGNKPTMVSPLRGIR